MLSCCNCLDDAVNAIPPPERRFVGIASGSLGYSERDGPGQVAGKRALLTFAGPARPDPR
jgi:hypothetical protein